MKTTVLMTLLLAVTTALAADPSAPAVAAQCAACHGADGNNADNGSNSGAPSLAGQLPDYLALQLANFKSGERPHAVMQAIADGLSAEQIVAVSTWYGAARPALPEQEAWMPKSDAALLARGQQLFSKGAASVPACASCHGEQGEGRKVTGSPPALYPRIASQGADYTLEQLKVYRQVPKFNNPLAMIMKAVAVKMSDADMQAVALYLSTVK